MGVAGYIEITGEDQAGLRLGLGGIDLEPVEGELRRLGHLLGRLRAGDGEDPVRDSPEEAGFRRAVFAAEEEEDAKHKNDDAGYACADQKCPIQHVRPRNARN